MALINCPECKKEISDSAKSCPSCGYELKQSELRKEEKKVIVKSELAHKKKSILGGVVIIGIIIISAVVIYFLESSDGIADSVSVQNDKAQKIASYIQERVSTGGFSGCTASRIDNQLVQVDISFPAGTDRLTVEANVSGVADRFAQAGLDSTIYYAGYSGRLKVCEYKYDRFTMMVKKTD